MLRPGKTLRVIALVLAITATLDFFDPLPRGKTALDLALLGASVVLLAAASLCRAELLRAARVEAETFAVVSDWQRPDADARAVFRNEGTKVALRVYGRNEDPLVVLEAGSELYAHGQHISVQLLGPSSVALRTGEQSIEFDVSHGGAKVRLHGKPEIILEDADEYASLSPNCLRFFASGELEDDVQQVGAVIGTERTKRPGSHDRLEAFLALFGPSAKDEAVVDPGLLADLVALEKIGALRRLRRHLEEQLRRDGKLTWPEVPQDSQPE